MCNPAVIPIALAIASAATAVYTTNEQNKATSAQAERQQDQINASAQEKTRQRMEEARALRASARASAAESAVAGNSLAMIETDIQAQAGQDVALIERNRRNGVEASTAEANARLRLSNAEMWSQIGSSAASGVSGAYDRYTIQSQGD